MNLFRRHCILILLLALVALSLFAQEKKEPAQREVLVPDQTASSLPKIDLPEFLITGQETIDLPASSKTAAEEDKVYVPASLSPGRKDVKTDLTQKPQKDAAGPSDQMNGRVLAGIGTYTSPFLEGWFGKNYDEGGILFHANFASSEGHVTNADWQKTGVGLSGDFRSPESFGVFAGSRLNGGMSFSGNSYRAYGSSSPSQLRTLNDVRVNIGLASATTTPGIFGAPLDYNAGIVWAGTSLSDSVSSSENDLGLTASAMSEKWGMPLRGTLEYLTSGVNTRLPADVGSHSPQWFVLKASAQRMITPVFQAALTLQQYVYRGNLSPTSGRFQPAVELRYFATDVSTPFILFAPSVERNTLLTLVNSNKYIQNSGELRPSEIPLSLTLGSDLALNERLQGRASVSYRSIQDFPFFVELNSAKVWDVMYLPKVSVKQADLEGSYIFLPGNSATLIASLNSTLANDSTNAVPNIPAFSFSGVYRCSMDAGVSIEGYARYMSKRWTNFAHSASNAGFVDIGAKGDYQFLNNLRAMVEIDNLLSQHYYLWDGYVERPMFISLGFTYKW